jgi:hypothetical protein
LERLLDGPSLVYPSDPIVDIPKGLRLNRREAR